MSYKCLYVLLLISDRLGIGMLTFALLMSARMGIFQETLYKRYGKHSKEALFYNVSVSPESDFFRVASRALFEPFKLHRYWSFSCFCVALPASAGLPAPLHGHLQPLRLLQSEQWVPLIYSGEPTLCLLTSRCKYISLSLSLSSYSCSCGWTHCAVNVALPADQRHHTVSCYLCGYYLYYVGAKASRHDKNN